MSSFVGETILLIAIAAAAVFVGLILASNVMAAGQAAGTTISALEQNIEYRLIIIAGFMHVYTYTHDTTKVNILDVRLWVKNVGTRAYFKSQLEEVTFVLACKNVTQQTTKPLVLAVNKSSEICAYTVDTSPALKPGQIVQYDIHCNLTSIGVSSVEMCQVILIPPLGQTDKFEVYINTLVTR